MSINQRELRNNAYYLVQSNEQGVLALRELSTSEYRQATSASFKLHLYHYHKRRELEVRLDLDDFFERYNHYEMKAITQDYTEKNEFFDRAYVDI